MGSLTTIAVERAFAVAKRQKQRCMYYRRAIFSVWLVAIILTAVFAVTSAGQLGLPLLDRRLCQGRRDVNPMGNTQCCEVRSSRL